MYCTNCGNLLKETDNFCDKCGYSIKNINIVNVNTPRFNKSINILNKINILDLAIDYASLIGIAIFMIIYITYTFLNLDIFGLYLLFGLISVVPIALVIGAFILNIVAISKKSIKLMSTSTSIRIVCSVGYLGLVSMIMLPMLFEGYASGIDAFSILSFIYSILILSVAIPKSIILKKSKKNNIINL